MHQCVVNPCRFGSKLGETVQMGGSCLNCISNPRDPRRCPEKANMFGVGWKLRVSSHGFSRSQFESEPSELSCLELERTFFPCPLETSNFYCKPQTHDTQQKQRPQSHNTSLGQRTLKTAQFKQKWAKLRKAISLRCSATT